MARATSPPFRHPRLSSGRGRGARSNHTGRYEANEREKVDDGWAAPQPSPSKTQVHVEKARRIITYNDSLNVGFDRSINPYRGCEHGCIYCFARPTHAYMGLSPGLDFEKELFVKPGAGEMLARELSAKRYKVRAIAIGTNTDPYQPIEKQFCMMRDILEVLQRFQHPVSILTKSALIVRDTDLLVSMAERGLARALLSVTTLDKGLARAMEPRASRPDKRLEAITRLSEAGIPTGVVHGPMIPGLNDHELEGLMEAAREAGARFATYTPLRLPQEVAGLFQEWLETFAPNHASKVLRHLREMNGGKLYDPYWSREAGPKGPYSQLLKARFAKAWRRLGFVNAPLLRTDLFKVPAPSGSTLQGDLFSNV
ncbi:MAG: PA0069 family radical SAM protein [Pseudomonadota bacterium]